MNDELGFAAILPELYVANLDASLRFYVETLGFSVRYARERPRFAFLTFARAGQLMLQQREAGDEWITNQLEHPFGRGVNLQIDTADVQALADLLLERGFPLVRGLQDSWYRGGDTLFGCREIIVQDPDGYMLRFSQSLGRKQAQPGRDCP